MSDKLIHCQFAIARWDEKVKYKKALIGLAREDSTVYLYIFYNLNKFHKFLMDSRSGVKLMPASIRIHNQKSDVFFRQPNDQRQYEMLIRDLNIILKQNYLTKPDQIARVRKYIQKLPTFQELGSNRQITTKLSNQRPEIKLLGEYANGSKEFTNLDDDTTTVTLSESFSQTLKNHRKKLLESQPEAITLNGYPFIPRELWVRTTLKELTLTYCNLTKIPQQIELFADSLSFLDLSHNKIKYVARSFCCSMNTLKKLDLSNNNIETLPIEIKFFRRLVNLNLSNNQLRMLPSTFSDLKHLCYLNVANNYLSQLPAFRKQEINLKELDVSHNPLDGSSREFNVFEVHPSYDDNHLGYQENLLTTPKTMSSINRKCPPRLFEIALLKVARDDRLIKAASREQLPANIISTMQREIFKCYECGQLNLLPAYNATDCLDYVQQVEKLTTTGNFCHRMTFMRLICKGCFIP